MDIHVKGSPSRCPYCKDGIGDVREVVACALCGARHHKECRETHGRCAVCSSTELLIYKASESPRSAPGLAMAREGDALVYRWRLMGKDGLTLVPRVGQLRLEPDSILFTALAGSRTFFDVSAPFARVGRVLSDGKTITIQTGDGDHTLATESIGYVLTPIELKILEQALATWKRRRV